MRRAIATAVVFGAATLGPAGQALASSSSGADVQRLQGCQVEEGLGTFCSDIILIGNLAATPGGNVMLTLTSHGTVTLVGLSESDSFTSEFRSVTHEFRKDSQDFSQLSLRLFSETRVQGAETCEVQLRLHSVNGVWQFETFESVCQPTA
jgi:hypothetical protein